MLYQIVCFKWEYVWDQLPKQAENCGEHKTDLSHLLAANEEPHLAPVLITISAPALIRSRKPTILMISAAAGLNSAAL